MLYLWGIKVESVTMKNIKFSFVKDSPFDLK